MVQSEIEDFTWPSRRVGRGLGKANSYWPIMGKVVGISDGDTVTVLDATRTQHKIRLSEIDTPEKNQAFGSVAKQKLSEKIFGKTVVVEYSGKDRYGRIIGKILFNGRWINEEMVEEGYAWHYKHYSKSKELAETENNARVKKIGLWRDSNPIPPWEFRRSGSKKATSPRKRSAPTTQRKTSVSTQQAVEQGYWLNTNSNVRHNRGCRYYRNTSSGRACGGGEGKACGICGG